MNDPIMTGILIAVVTAVLTSILNYRVQSSLFKLQSKRDISKERLTKLLLPLYIQLKKEGVIFAAEIVHENGDPGGFLDDLPKYYHPLEGILSDHLYLADNELTEKALNFIKWVNVARYDTARFDKIMTNQDLDDEPLEIFKECVFKKYEKERKHFLE